MRDSSLIGRFFYPDIDRMKWSGLNKSVQGYGGPGLDLQDLYSRVRDIEKNSSYWSVEYRLSSDGNAPIPVFSNGSVEGNVLNSIYISAGIHGDEPAGPLAIMDIIEKELLSKNVSWRIFPFLNPTGLSQNSRTNKNGSDLNRDYHPDNRNPQIEVFDHIRYLDTCPKFDISIMIHEDWEADGFYLYQLHKNNPIRYGSELICYLGDSQGLGLPIDKNPFIDGREADNGVIDVSLLDHIDRPDWPESFLIANTLTDLSYTIEAPSDLDLRTRVDMLSESIRFLVRKHTNTD